MKPLFLFVRPPRSQWFFNGRNSAFWQPLAFASLASSLRDNIPEIRVEILDCPVMKMGWQSLAREMTNRSPRFVGIGEESVSCAEGLRLARIAKSLGATVIAGGGCSYGNLASYILLTGLVDVVVHGEGERTIVDLVNALLDWKAPTDLNHVRGISFLQNDSVMKTSPRPHMSFPPEADRNPARPQPVIEYAYQTERTLRTPLIKPRL